MQNKTCRGEVVNFSDIETFEMQQIVKMICSLKEKARKDKSLKYAPWGQFVLTSYAMSASSRGNDIEHRAARALGLQKKKGQQGDFTDEKGEIGESKACAIGYGCGYGRPGWKQIRIEQEIAFYLLFVIEYYEDDNGNCAANLLGWKLSHNEMYRELEKTGFQETHKGSPNAGYLLPQPWPLPLYWEKWKFDTDCIKEDLRKSKGNQKTFSSDTGFGATIKKIEELPEDDVWDITMTGDEHFYKKQPNFIADGILVHNCSAAGMVISPVPLGRICPLHKTRSSSEGETLIATQFPKDEVESIGLIKFDVLGVATLTALSLAVKMIKDSYGVVVDLTKLPLDDPMTLDLYNSGKTDGVFQCENWGMKQTLQQIGINSFDDLMIAVAMYRPGPKDYIPELAKRKKNPELIKYAHPLMKKITEKTYGILTYQEEVMRAFVELADLSAEDGYTFLKGCAKKKPEIVKNYKDRFVKGAIKNDIPPAVVDRTWKDLERHSGYSFNAAHACAYSILSWKTAYLKAHYPVEFMCARLSVEARRKNQDDVFKYEEDARKNLGIKILPPDLNKSKMDYVKTGEKELLRPLLIKSVGDKAAEEIIRCQPYEGPDILESFALKIGHAVNIKVVEAMASQKMFGDIPKKTVLKAFEIIKADRQKSKGKPVGDIRKGIKGKVRRKRH